MAGAAGQHQRDDDAPQTSDHDRLPAIYSQFFKNDRGLVSMTRNQLIFSVARPESSEDQIIFNGFAEYSPRTTEACGARSDRARWLLNSGFS
jgi:hypothetical protein